MEGINPWENHYKKTKSLLIYPDENLVRMLQSFLNNKTKSNLRAIDLGCGSGRHMRLLHELGINFITGLDYSINALAISSTISNKPLVLGDNKNLPIRDNSFDIVVAWGTLHYSRKQLLNQQLREIHRIMKEDGRFFGTLRSDRDTYLKRGKDIGGGTWITDLDDINNSIVSFYSEDELNYDLSVFKKLEYGIMERTLIGDMERIISHWVFWAEK